MNEFSLTIDPNAVLDGIAIVVVAVIMLALTFAPRDPAFPLLKWFCLAALGVVLAAVSINCAPVTPPVSAPTAASRPIDRGSAERCVELVVAACEHDVKCGDASAAETQKCLQENAPACVGATGLTETETERCGAALRAAPCPGVFPSECVGIIGGAPDNDEVAL